jgi:FkbM family methyltransferase
MIVKTSERGFDYKWWVDETASEFQQAQEGVGPRRGHEEPILDFVINNIANRSKRFIDVGANVGYWAIRMVNYFSDVIAIEPEINNSATLFQNVQLNKIRLGNEMMIFREIVTSPEKIMFPLGLEKDKGGETRVIETPDGKQFVKRILDDYRPNFEMNCIIKIDTEGHEVDILKGATELLKDRSIFIIEDHEGVYPECTGHRKLIAEIMEDNKYQVAVNFGNMTVYMKY